ncbi:hypothetical protein HGG76_06085 [Ochrobactrum tritici]|uniref:Uncharacterized protein n=1 Tax=Brucella tritici TaxID=94626 RepID=A0A7X6FR15_9HYPH|nr:hypothetical protein [Brucella tritici]
MTEVDRSTAVRERKREQAQAKSLEDLVALGRARGMKNPTDGLEKSWKPGTAMQRKGTRDEKYADFIKTGDLEPMEALKMQSVRDAARAGATDILAHHSAQGLPCDAAAFGMLDAIAVRFVEWYGPEQAEKCFRHYGEVCARQPKKGGKS